MHIFDAVRLVINRLAPRGWQQLLALHGLRLDAAELASELTRPLANTKGESTIDREVPGFDDFCPSGLRAIEPGKPALSLLYHALASPHVYPSVVGARTDQDFPTLEELDVIENYIYSLARKGLKDFNNAVVAVFAYQYRSGARSVHRVHADMAYSRAGIARVGTALAHYDAVRRSFWVAPANNAPGVSVMPARYAAFIAERRKLTAEDSVIHPLAAKIPGDDKRTFLVPVHKLFPGEKDECLVGDHVEALSFLEYHRSEKLRRIHVFDPAKGGVPALPGFDTNQAPFVRESKDLVTLRPTGASILLVPNSRSTLAETATQFNSKSGKDEIVRFRVPPQNSSLGGGRGNRFDESSFQIPAMDAGRAAPEYAHIRLHVRPTGQLFDVNILSTSDFLKVLREARFEGVAGLEDGPLEAAHLVDGSCDGAIAVRVHLSRQLEIFCAVSFVAAPDFLPLVDQIEVQRWAEERKIAGSAVYFSQGGPEPLCYGRDCAPNPALVDPSNHSRPAFERAEPANRTFTAVLSRAPESMGSPISTKVSVSTTWLPDAAADVFEPGWDTSMFSDKQGEFYANYGLGSPFPEDTKLCAALNSFWPATAPDVGRTFGQMTALPLLDGELGFHSKHPKVLAGQATSSPGWDGEFGPFFVGKGKKVNFASIVRGDYTVNSLHGQIGIGELGQIDTVEQLARMDAFRECADRIRGNTPMNRFKGLLVTAEKVSDWTQRRDRFDPSLSGAGYFYVFADVRNPPQDDPTDPRRQIGDVVKTYTCQVTSQLVAIRTNGGRPDVTPWRHPVRAGSAPPSATARPAYATRATRPAPASATRSGRQRGRIR